MKICFLAPANSAHIVKWCAYFVSRGHQVYVVSFTEGDIPGAVVHRVDVGVDAGGSDLSKFKYLLFARKVRGIVDALAPDVVSVHYASSYGAVAALAGLKHYTLSVWGSDVYEFPQKTPLHRLLLRYSLKRAGLLLSTSRTMAEEAGRYTNKPFEITPFGVDCDLFSPARRTRTNDGVFVIGTVKGLTYKYGIDYLIRAVALFHRELPEVDFVLRIAGRGRDETAFRRLAVDEGVDKYTVWLGYISQEQAAVEWANMDVAVVSSSSSSESFGVSAVEAQACGVPVIVSDVPGLMESTCPDESSIVVPKCDERALADAIVNLYRDKELRRSMGRQGRVYVLERYEYKKCFSRIEKRLVRACCRT